MEHIEQNLQETTVNLVYKSTVIFVEGKYTKFARNMSQTPWEVEGIKMVG